MYRVGEAPEYQPFNTAGSGYTRQCFQPDAV